MFDLSRILNIVSDNSNRSGKLKNKTFMFTGKLDGISRAEAKSMIEKNSGNTMSNISKNLDFLVIGENPTKRKIEQAKKLNIKVIKQKELYKLLN